MSRRVVLVALALLCVGGGVGVALALAAPDEETTRVRTTTVPVFGFTPVFRIPRCVRVERVEHAELARGPAPVALTARLGLLRRPATPADALGDDALALLRTLPLSGIHLDAARHLPDAPGSKERWAIPIADTRPSTRLDRRCLAELGPKRRASVLERYARLRARPADPGLLVLTRGGEQYFGMVALSRILRGGGFAERPCLGPRGELLGLDGFIPDGVSEIHAAFAGGRRVDATVQDNTARIVLPRSERGALRELVYLDPGGKVERHVAFRRAGVYAGVCGPRPQIAAGSPVAPAPARSPQGGVVEQRTVEAFIMDAPALQSVVRPPVPRARCVAVGTPLPRTAPAAPGIRPDGATQQCAVPGHVRAQTFVAGLARRDDGTVVLSGFAASRVRWIQVKGIWPRLTSTARPGPSGAFFLAIGRPHPDGLTVGVRAAVHANPTIYTPWRKLRLAPGRAPGPHVMPESVKAFGVFARPRTLADAFPVRFDVLGRRGDHGALAGKVDLRGARRVARSDVWVVPGRQTVCVIVRPSLTTASVSCGPAAAAARGQLRPAWGSEVLAHLLPDGVTGVEADYRGRRGGPVPVRDNVALIPRRGDADPVALRWIAADGTPQRATFR